MQKQYRTLDSDRVIVDIAVALAEEEGVPPNELEYTLHDYIATEALIRLIEDSKSDWKLTFQVPDHQVTVTGDGAISVDS